jgi:hypothetical protein
VYDAKIDQLNDTGASISGTVKIANVQGSQSLGLLDDASLVADIELMFSHIDNNMSGLKFPDHNFVFTEQFTDLLKTYRSGTDVKI